MRLSDEATKSPSFLLGLDARSLFISLCLFLCAFSLVFIAFSLRPVAKWAKYQSICVENESLKSPVEWAVRKCNGRSKVYQVK